MFCTINIMKMNNIIAIDICLTFQEVINTMSYQQFLFNANKNTKDVDIIEHIQDNTIFDVIYFFWQNTIEIT